MEWPDNKKYSWFLNQLKSMSVHIRHCFNWPFSWLIAFVSTSIAITTSHIPLIEHSLYSGARSASITGKYHPLHPTSSFPSPHSLPFHSISLYLNDSSPLNEDMMKCIRFTWGYCPFLQLWFFLQPCQTLDAFVFTANWSEHSRRTAHIWICGASMCGLTELSIHMSNCSWL